MPSQCCHNTPALPCPALPLALDVPPHRLGPHRKPASAAQIVCATVPASGPSRQPLCQLPGHRLAECHTLDCARGGEATPLDLRGGGGGGCPWHPKGPFTSPRATFHSPLASCTFLINTSLAHLACRICWRCSGVGVEHSLDSTWKSAVGEGRAGCPPVAQASQPGAHTVPLPWSLLFLGCSRGASAPLGLAQLLGWTGSRGCCIMSLTQALPRPLWQRSGLYPG